MSKVGTARHLARPSVCPRRLVLSSLIAAQRQILTGLGRTRVWRPGEGDTPYPGSLQWLSSVKRGLSDMLGRRVAVNGEPRVAVVSEAGFE